jgi:uncharacterized protein YegL
VGRRPTEHQAAVGGPPVGRILANGCGPAAGGVAEQIPFGDIELATNPEPRCPCVLLLDVSGSMAGAPIAALNEGVRAYKTELIADSLAAQRVEVAVVTFGGRVETVCPFSTAHSFEPPTLIAGGDTPMGQGIVAAIEMVEQRKKQYKQQGLHYFRPWIFMFTDGEPTDSWQAAAEQVKQKEACSVESLLGVGPSNEV